MTNSDIIQPSESGSQAPSGGFSSQTGKRKQIGDEVNNGGIPATDPVDPARKMSKPNQDDNGSASAPPISVVQKKARETRLEQNRKAARESRRRKKVMIEDLQKSVIFFSRANGALKHQNDELTRLLMQAQAQVSVLESATNANSNGNNSVSDGTSSATSSNPAQRHPQQPQPPPHPHQQQQQQQPNSTIELPATNPATTTPSSQPVIHSGVPTSAASQLHQAYPTFPVMQPGATMQAMASFQQAAAAAMQVAVQGMQGISPGVSLTSLAQTSPSSGQSASQVYNDTMTALAMQQAAAAAAAVPPHLVAQMMGTTGTSNGWTMAAAAANGTAPVTILPAPKGVSTLLPAPLAPNPTQVVPVAPVPASTATTTPPGEQRTE